MASKLGKTMGGEVLTASAMPSREYDANLRSEQKVHLHVELRAGSVGIEHNRRDARQAKAWHKPGVVSLSMTPKQARDLAEFLLKAADEKI